MTRLMALFEQALDVPQEQRADFLERVTDRALRQELGSLVEAHESSTDYFARLAASVVSPAYAAVFEAAPASSLRSVSLPTTATVRWTSSPTAAGLEAIEYTRPVTGRSEPTSASGVQSAG